MILDPHEHLERMLTRLKLTAIRDQLGNLIDEAGRRDLTIREALTMFCEREIARKDHRRIEMSFGLARFPFVRSISGFDFEAQPSIDKAQIRELCTGRFVANGEAVLLLGPPGVGKSHLAVAIGREVIIAGYTVLFIPAVTLVAALARAHAEGNLEDKLSQLAKPKLLIVDELGYLPFGLRRPGHTARDGNRGAQEGDCWNEDELLTWCKAKPHRKSGLVEKGRVTISFADVLLSVPERVRRGGFHFAVEEVWPRLSLMYPLPGYGLQAS